MNIDETHDRQVVDAGFSFTHALPLFEGQLLLDGVRRINLGGKALTNYFKELVSYRWVLPPVRAPVLMLLTWVGSNSTHCWPALAMAMAPVDACCSPWHSVICTLAAAGAST
jgi:Actin